MTAAPASPIETRSVSRRTAWATGFDARGKRDPEELRHRLVEVEEERDADQPERQRREREEVRRGVDLDERVAAAAVGAGEGPRRAGEEREVLGEVGEQARALVAPDVEAMDGHAGELAGRGVAVAPEPEDVDRTARGDERFRLAPDARVLVVVGVDEHRDGPAFPVYAPRARPRLLAPSARVAGVRAQPPLQPAPEAEHLPRPHLAAVRAVDGVDDEARPPVDRVEVDRRVRRDDHDGIGGEDARRGRRLVRLSPAASRNVGTCGSW